MNVLSATYLLIARPSGWIHYLIWCRFYVRFLMQPFNVSGLGIELNLIEYLYYFNHLCGVYAPLHTSC